MQNISEYLSRFQVQQVEHKKGEARNPREERINSFMKKINEGRNKQANIELYKKWLKDNKLRHSIENVERFKKTRYYLKPLTFTLVAKKLKSYSSDCFDWDILYRKCSDSKNFGASFWFFIKGT